MSEAPDRIRLDKWLHFARFFKTRTLSAAQITGGHVRVNAARASKAAMTVGAGDVLIFTQGREIRVIRIMQTGTRRGPANEAQALYEDLSPPAGDTAAPAAIRAEGHGRPTKKDRRALDALKTGDG